ncbi:MULTISPECIES: hypothetical protein [Streptomyces]|uniref:Uncharacterized protein n=1 Tax=Streptomyces venezuelae (strain ATCC 10712 / CBS 650.69 / DSM 40230 / JCM 4526 / NBRC 13096 / PD 04745) TaxID=953739 RepID=F2R9Q4_STRVP|nr:hypothetical protein [Streptomyces venezuelae]APE20148.1 hypothetical protein vnz_03435 [Streptomyces venezuelae]QER97547.1 hypothetical protein DEJ43_03470 [Streptomyces venezuelae ATCC 10712]CCA54004.1 hypothetical protein SVEN_0717 [Streptomyces venezuelae ATCC 10712]
MSRQVLERFPAGGPRGSWPAEEFAGARRDEGVPARVVMDLETDTFLVIVEQRTPERVPEPVREE